MKALLIALVACLGLAGCSSDRPDGIRPATQAQLQQDVLTLTQAAARKDYAAAQAALAVLQADLAAASAAGHISDAKRDEIRTIAARVQGDLTVATRIPVPTVTVSIPPPPEPTKGKPSKGKDKDDD